MSTSLNNADFKSLLNKDSIDNSSSSNPKKSITNNRKKERSLKWLAMQEGKKESIDGNSSRNSKYIDRSKLRRELLNQGKTEVEIEEKYNELYKLKELEYKESEYVEEEVEDEIDLDLELDKNINKPHSNIIPIKHESDNINDLNIHISTAVGKGLLSLLPKLKPYTPKLLSEIETVTTFLPGKTAYTYNLPTLDMTSVPNPSTAFELPTKIYRTVENDIAYEYGKCPLIECIKRAFNPSLFKAEKVVHVEINTSQKITLKEPSQMPVPKFGPNAVNIRKPVKIDDSDSDDDIFSGVGSKYVFTATDKDKEAKVDIKPPPGPARPPNISLNSDVDLYGTEEFNVANFVESAVSSANKMSAVLESKPKVSDPVRSNNRPNINRDIDPAMARLFAKTEIQRNRPLAAPSIFSSKVITGDANSLLSMAKSTVGSAMKDDYDVGFEAGMEDPFDDDEMEVEEKKDRGTIIKEDAKKFNKNFLQILKKRKEDSNLQKEAKKIKY